MDDINNCNHTSIQGNELREEGYNIREERSRSLESRCQGRGRFEGLDGSNQDRGT